MPRAGLLLLRSLTYKSVMSRGNAIFLVVVVVIVLIAVGAASILHNGLSARANPTALEIMPSRNAPHLAIPANPPNLQNPVTEKQENLRDAPFHFAQHCHRLPPND